LTSFSGDSPYGEFAARVRRQDSGSNKDHDWDESGNPTDGNSGKLDGAPFFAP